MRATFIIKAILITSAIGIALTGCKTTEENYRSAYEITKAKKTEGLSQEEIAGFAREESIAKSVYKGDSIPMKTEYMTRVEGGVDDAKSLAYNVIVASFKQIFNARSVLKRLREGGYQSAILLSDRTSRYYVGAVTTSSLDSAVITMQSLQRAGDASPVALRAPYPYIMRNASIPGAK